MTSKPDFKSHGIIISVYAADARYVCDSYVLVQEFFRGVNLWTRNNRLDFCSSLDLGPGICNVEISIIFLLFA